MIFFCLVCSVNQIVTLKLVKDLIYTHYCPYLFTRDYMNVSQLNCPNSFTHLYRTGSARSLETANTFQVVQWLLYVAAN